MGKLFTILGLCLFTLTTYATDSISKQAQQQNETCSYIKSQLQQGDLIFMAIGNIVFEKVAESSKSWTSHVGIAIQNSKGDWLVTESTFPFSKTGPLCDYLRRAQQGQIAVTRLKQMLSDEDIEAVKESASNRMNVLYHQGFDFDTSWRSFCSKFVYDVYKEALAIEVGRIQTFKEMFDENPEGDIDFWTTYFLGSIPWERRTVTPHSQLIDPQFETIYSWDFSN